MRPRLLVGVLSLWLVGGCAGVSPVQVGQTAGTIAGSLLAPGVGGPVGALVGLLGGMLVQGEVDKVVAKRERHDLGGQLAGRPAADGSLEMPPAGEPTRVWVDETIRDGRLAAGHFEVRYIP